MSVYDKADRKYFQNIGWNFLGVVVMALLSLVSTPILIKYMGNEDFGLYRIGLVSLVSFALILDSGISSAAKHLIGKAANSDIPGHVNKALGLSIKVYAVMSGLAFLVVCSGMLWIPLLVAIPDAKVEEFRVLLLGAAFFVAMKFFEAAFRALFVVLGRFGYIQLITVASYAVRTLLTVTLVFFFDNNLLYAALAAVLSAVMAGVAFYFFSKIVFPGLFVDFNYKGTYSAKEFGVLGGYGLAVAVAPIFLFYSQDFFVSFYYGLENLVYFAAAMILVVQFKTLLTAVATPLLSVAGSVLSRKNSLEIKMFVRNAFCRSIAFWGIFAIPVIIVSDDFFKIWLGSGYGESVLVFNMLMLGTLGISLYVAGFQFLTALGKLRVPAYLSIGTVMASIMMTVLWAGPYGGGLVAIAVALTVPLIVRGVCVSLYVSFLSGASLRSALALILKILSVIFFAILLPKLFFGGEVGVLGLLMHAFIAFVLSSFVMFYFFVTREDKRRTKAFLRSFTVKVRSS